MNTGRALILGSFVITCGLVFIGLAGRYEVSLHAAGSGVRVDRLTGAVETCLPNMREERNKGGNGFVQIFRYECGQESSRPRP